MDNFMDKLAQRFNAQEIIKANSQAEAQETGRLREQLKVYDEYLQEMRKLNLKNVETAEKAQQLTQRADAMAKQANALVENANMQAEQVRTLTAQMSELTGQAINALEENRGKENEKMDAALAEMESVLAEMKNAFEESGKAITENQEKLIETGVKLEEFIHKECVKVYRNVQAVLSDELKNQTKELEEKISQSQKGKGGLYLLLVLTLLASLGNLGVILAQMFGLL